LRIAPHSLWSPVQDLEPDPGKEEVDDHQGHAKGHPASKGQSVGWAEAAV